ncbi:MAG: HlyC/CorC family transporter [Solobacterium sp.]|nr:HlyC/CorC family transporter [Solobacterium sp.]
MTTVYILAIIVCILLSGFFSASEMSFSSSNKIRLENMVEEGSKAAEVALYLSEHFDDALSTILVGNNLVNIAASSLGTLTMILTAGEEYTWIATLAITICVIIFGETIPKITAKKNATKFSLVFAGPVRLLMILFKPVTWVVVHLVNLITFAMKPEEVLDEEAAVEELHSIIETAEDEEVIDEDSSELISAAIDFADISVSEVMTARVDILAIDVDDSWEEIMEVVNASSFSRIPVYEDSIDNIIGILSLNRFLKASIDQKEFDIREMIMQPYFVYKTTKLPSVLSTLRDSQQHLAIVTDEYGGTLGVVSMEDVLEELVGEIWDETDVVEKGVSEISENQYVIDGDLPVSELIDLMDWDETEFDYESETAGGWCIEMLDEFPDEGESFTYEDTVVKVLEVEERRVTKIQLLKKEKQEDK